jgi:hypothetical protein
MSEDPGSKISVWLDVVRGTAEVVRALVAGTEYARRRVAATREAKQALGLHAPEAEAYRSDAVHPLFTGGAIHPDNRVALHAVGSDALIGEPTVREDLRVDPFDRSLLLFGSPISEGLSRIVFGYEEVAGVEGLICRDPPLDLAYTWDLDPAHTEDGRVGRYVPGRGVVKRPLWRIKDLRNPQADHLTPEPDAEGLLSNDFLLVTRVRNFLAPEGVRGGQFLVSFGGAHGTGTRAVELLLADRQLLDHVLEALKQEYFKHTKRRAGLPKAYQLLFEVPRIDHTPAGSVPRALELVGATVLPDADADWERAHRLVAPRLQMWRPDHDAHDTQPPLAAADRESPDT